MGVPVVDWKACTSTAFVDSSVTSARAAESCSSVTVGSVVQKICASPGNDGMISTLVPGAYRSPGSDTVPRGWANRPWTVNRLVSAEFTPGPPMPGPSMRKKFVPNGLPTTWCSTPGSPT